jgi:C_GCAxxG_C_C family probable redox protein
MMKSEKKIETTKTCCSCKCNDSQLFTADSDKVAKRSRELFDNGYFCAESVLMALAEAHERNDKGLCSLMTGFCGGMGRSGGPCGALTGGIAAIGMLFGRKDNKASQVECYTLTYNLVREFEKRFGSTTCTGVLGCDISTSEGAEFFAKQGLEEEICSRVTEESAGLLQELINNRTSLTHPLIDSKN